MLFEGWKLFHNLELEKDYHSENTDRSSANVDEIEKSVSFINDEISEPQEGNQDRDVWKLMALEFCQLVNFF